MTFIKVDPNQRVPTKLHTRVLITTRRFRKRKMSKRPRKMKMMILRKVQAHSMKRRRKKKSSTNFSKNLLRLYKREQILLSSRQPNLRPICKRRRRNVLISLPRTTVSLVTRTTKKLPMAIHTYKA